MPRSHFGRCCARREMPQNFGGAEKRSTCPTRATRETGTDGHGRPPSPRHRDMHDRGAPDAWTSVRCRGRWLPPAPATRVPVAPAHVEQSHKGPALDFVMRPPTRAPYRVFDQKISCALDRLGEPAPGPSSTRLRRRAQTTLQFIPPMSFADTCNRHACDLRRHAHRHNAYCRHSQESLVAHLEILRPASAHTSGECPTVSKWKQNRNAHVCHTQGSSHSE